jgi:small subunit ribosomal protein S1
MKDSRLEKWQAELDEALAGTVPQARSDESGARRRYTVTVAGSSGGDVFVELGPRVQGVIASQEFDEPPKVGETLEVALRGQEDGLWLFSAKEARALAAWDEMDVGSLVKGTVIGLNKGGLELKVGSIRAFMPASQVDLKHVEDLTGFAGETMVCEVLEIDRGRERVVVSRRAVLEAEREEQREQAAETMAEGVVVRGKVSRLESFGAFVRLTNGLEGLLHVSNISHRRVEDPSEVLKIGQELELLVLEIKEGGRRIGLGRKQLEEDPWDGIEARVNEDHVTLGRVRRLVDFGAFIEIEPGVEGLLHVSELGQGRVRNVRDVLREDEEVVVRVLHVDAAARRLSLTRLDPRGALLGSDEAPDQADLERALDRDGSGSIGTNLGALFRKALGKDGSQSEGS